MLLHFQKAWNRPKFLKNATLPVFWHFPSFEHSPAALFSLLASLIHSLLTPATIVLHFYLVLLRAEGIYGL